MKFLFREAIGYAAASGCALAADIAILWVLVEFFSWDFLAAATLSFLAGAVVAYQLSVKLAFKHHTLRDRRLEFVTFIAIGTLGVAVNAAVIFLAVTWLGMHYLVAKCTAAMFTFMCNFFLRRQILFARHSSV
jgi:putative flippase GtrA